MMRYWMTAVMLLALATLVSAEELSGLCISVADGDTLSVLDAARQRQRIRLYGIDSPELSQPYGREARTALSKLAFRREVRVVVVDRDRYGRLVGEVFVGGKPVNVEMIRCGLAWHYRRYAPQRSDFAAAQSSAQAAHVGVWSESRPLPPWLWRKIKRHRR